MQLWSAFGTVQPFVVTFGWIRPHVSPPSRLSCAWLRSWLWDGPETKPAACSRRCSNLLESTWKIYWKGFLFGAVHSSILNLHILTCTYSSILLQPFPLLHHRLFRLPPPPTLHHFQQRFPSASFYWRSMPFSPSLAQKTGARLRNYQTLLAAVSDSPFFMLLAPPMEGVKLADLDIY